jgi:hypothetical protein
VTQGIHRVTWDLREPSAALPKAKAPDAVEELFVPPPQGPLVIPGKYKVSLAKRVGGVTTPLGVSQEFTVVVPGSDALNPADRKALGEFQQKVVRLQRAVSGTLEVANELSGRLERIKRTLDHAPALDAKWQDVVRALEKKNRDILRALRGDVVLRQRNENTPVSISERVQYLVSTHRFSLARPTGTQQDNYRIASEEFAEELAKLRRIIEVELPPLERALDEAGLPWTPGRLPVWKKD